MNTAGRLIIYGAGLAVAFAGAFTVAGAVVPDGFVNEWKDKAQMSEHDGGHDTMTTSSAATGPRGLSLAADGMVLSPVSAPDRAGVDGTLSYRILDADGRPVVRFARSHEKDMHLIVVRSDGSRFEHVHPTLDTATGTWSIPWTWETGGTYRVFADFVPATEEAPSITLTRTVDVAGALNPEPATAVTRTTRVGGFDVSIEGGLVAGRTSELDITVKRDGQPVTELQPYLGAFGHLVALREGDLGFLHVHAEGDAPQAGDTAGPTISFMAEAPTAGRYLLYLDFQVDGQVRTARLVLDATPANTPDTGDEPAHDDDH